MRAACAGTGHQSAALARTAAMDRARRGEIDRSGSSRKLRMSEAFDSSQNLNRHNVQKEAAESQPDSLGIGPGRHGRAARCAHWQSATRRRCCPTWIMRGSTCPEKRSTSTFWLTPICFSPAITSAAVGAARAAHDGGDRAREIVRIVRDDGAGARADWLSEPAGDAGSVERVGGEQNGKRRDADRGHLGRSLSIVLELFCVAEIFSTIVHRDRVADEPRAVVLEQRPVLRPLEDGEPLFDLRCTRGCHRRRHVRSASRRRPSGRGL